MVMTNNTQLENNVHQSSYIIPGIATTTVINNGNETPTFSDIKILCNQRKKRSKYHIYLTFVENSSLLLPNEQPCIEILNKKNSSTILLNDCISFEYFDEIKNDYQSFIYIYFQSYTISIYFSDEYKDKKSFIIKYLEYTYKTKFEKLNDINNQELLTTTEQILHTFDVKLIPYETIITRDHILVGRTRIYFTTTDLFIASIDCNRTDLKQTITNQCPSKDKTILCIPYFTIKHYGNRSNIFLIELGKSNYGNGEIHMKCFSSSLASTIHLLVSPVIEERPLILSSAFQNQFLTSRRIEKSKNIHPPIQLNHDITNQFILNPLLPFIKKHSIESLPEKSPKLKTHLITSFFRKLTKNSSTLKRSCTFNNTNQNQLNSQSNNLSLSLNKFFEINIQEKNSSNDQNQIILPLIDSSKLINNKISSNQPETTNGTYIDMGSTVQKSDQNQQEKIQNEQTIKATTATVDVGTNTTISLSPRIHSAIIVGNTVHLIAEERIVFPIGQRSFTSPASVMQPFKTQLNGQTTINNFTTSTDMVTCAPNSSSSFHHPTSTSNSQQSLLLSYGIVTFNSNSLTTDQTENISNSLSNESTIDGRLNSDLSLMSISHQQQPSNIYSYDNIISSSNSRLFHRLSVTTNNNGDNNISNKIHTSEGSIINFDENFTDQTTNYLLGPLPTLIDDTIQTNLSRISSLNLITHLSSNDKENIPLNDPYALVEPLSLHNSPVSSLSTLLIKPSLSSNKSFNYTELLLPLNTGDEQEELNSSDNNDNSLVEEKYDRSSTIIYTDIDYHQTQRHDRIAQYAAKSKTEDQIPPFIL